MGIQVHNDDICIIDVENNKILPSIPYIKLWLNSLKNLNCKTDDYFPVHPGAEKFIFPIENYKKETVNISQIYQLVLKGSSKTSITEISNHTDCFLTLFNNLYLKQLLKYKDIASNHFCLLKKFTDKNLIFRAERGNNVSSDSFLFDFFSYFDEVSA